MGKNEWHLDKKVPIGIFVALVCNIFIGGFLLSKVVSRLDYNDSRLLKVENTLDTRGQMGNEYYNKLATLETQFIEFKKTIELAINRIDGNLEKLVDRQYNENNKRKF